MTTVRSLAVARRLAADGTARRLREEAGLSLADLARDVGVRATSVWRWETGQRVPRGELAVRYARMLEELAAVVDILRAS